MRDRPRWRLQDSRHLSRNRRNTARCCSIGIDNSIQSIQSIKLRPQRDRPPTNVQLQQGKGTKNKEGCTQHSLFLRRQTVRCTVSHCVATAAEFYDRTWVVNVKTGANIEFIGCESDIAVLEAIFVNFDRPTTACFPSVSRSSICTIRTTYKLGS